MDIRNFFKPTNAKRKSEETTSKDREDAQNNTSKKRKKGFNEEEEEGEYEFKWCPDVDGLGIIEDFISKEEEDAIFKEIEQDEFHPSDKYTGTRLWQQKGTIVDFKIDYVHWDKVIPLPNYSINIIDKFHKVKGLKTFNPNQQFNNIYTKAKGDSVYFHTDHRGMFNDIVMCVSLLGDCDFQMKSIKDPKLPVVSFPFPKRAAVIMTRKARYEWRHGIPNDALKDEKRISITYRELKSDYRNKEDR
eukprot:Phypoly_transcript_17538.p1 GENE.Phypoly_transcript_17538~~Phypoly_transcript_17538.p1  ORF type:complete len:253 (+),score=37.12 Phypoly_transcript_17538:23-760(+)